MIIEAIFNALKTVIFSLFSWIDLPNMSDYGTGFDEAFNMFGEMLESTKGIINLFLPWGIVKFGLPILIIVLSFEHIYHFVMWVIKKLPFLGIE